MSEPHEPADETRVERTPQPPVPDPDDLDSTRWDAANVDPAGPPVDLGDDEDDEDDEEREPGLTTRWDGPLEPPPPPPPKSGKTTRWVKRPGDESE